MKNIYDMNRNQLEDIIVKLGYKKYNALQVFEWIYQKKVRTFNEMSNVKKELRKQLEEEYYFGSLTVVKKQESSDGTIKFLFSLEDGNTIETVLMRHNYGRSVCVTTQIGCNLGCKFCASGLTKKVRDLSAGEIVLQVLTVQELIQERVSHVVVMGIGEPFDNYDNFMRFVKNINDAKGLAIGARHITVSTCGIVPKIYDFAKEKEQVNLAISLHAPNDEIRNLLMPISYTYSIDEVIEACQYYVDCTNRRITFEYILIKGMNDDLLYADLLSDLIRGMNAYVNLIPFNGVDEFGYQTPSKEHQMAFYSRLKKRGINCTLRREKGNDIDAACGQLRSKLIKNKE